MVECEKNYYQKVPTRELINDDKPEVPPSYGYGVRHMQIFLFFFCMTIGYMARAHLGVSVVAMTRHTDDNNITSIVNSTITNGTDARTVNETEKNNHNEIEFETNETSKKINDYEEDDSIWNVYRTYKWTKTYQEMILSSFFIGYSIMMFPMGMVCQRYGGKIPLQICLLVNGLVSLVTPTVAVWGGWKAVCCCRILQGLSQSGLWPSTHTLLAKWVPISERATFSSYVYTGGTLGTIISFQVGGLLAYSTAGWPSSFWLIGACCIGAFVLISVFAAASPDDHKSISSEEKNFILGRIDDGSKRRIKTPWKKIISSKHVRATFVSHICCTVCFIFLFTQIPTYMHYILGFDIKNSGLLSSLPFIASFVCAIAYGLVSDYCINKGIVTIKTARIASNSLAQVGPAICLIAVSYTENRTVAVVLLIVAVGFYSGMHTGWMVNYIDMSPNFSGSLMAMGNTGAAFGILSQPFLISNIITEVTDRSQWRVMMFLMAGLIFFSNVIYVCFMSTDKQPWDEIDEQDEAVAMKVIEKSKGSEHSTAKTTKI